ncbi:ankyrin repeat-containing domain protein [Xylaria digitata]|nr:ankyrin repeat-containing domain protein [Xylaria digitata]
MSSTVNKSRTLSVHAGFKELLESAVTINDTDLIKKLAEQYELIKDAAEKNNFEQTNELSKQLPGEHDATISAFTKAAGFGHQEAMKLILELRLTSFERAGAAGLVNACANGRIETVKFLLEKMLSSSSFERAAPAGLASAFTNGHVEIVKLLQEKMVTSVRGGFSIYPAVLGKHTETVRLLLENNIGVGDVSAALIIAVSNGDDETAELLIQHGAKKDSAALLRAIKDNTQQTALRLIEAGYEVNDRFREKGRMALYLAAERGQYKVLETLLAHQAKVDALDYWGQTPLHLAAAGGHIGCAEALIDSGADLLVEDQHGQTALQIAERNKCTAIVDLLNRRIEDGGLSTST